MTFLKKSFVVEVRNLQMCPRPMSWHSCLEAKNWERLNLFICEGNTCERLLFPHHLLTNIFTETILLVRLAQSLWWRCYDFEDRVLILISCRIFLCRHIEATYGPSPLPSTLGTRGSFAGLKQLESKDGHSPLFSVEFKNAWSFVYPPLPIHR